MTFSKTMPARSSSNDQRNYQCDIMPSKEAERMDELELRTLSDLMRERDRLKDLLELLEAGETEKAKEKIRRDIQTISEIIESK